MSVELLNTLSLVCYVAAGVMLAAAIVLFFSFKIPAVIGDISGSSAKKAIENIRQQNMDSGGKAYKPSPVNSARGKLTDKISPSGNIGHRTSGPVFNVGTEKISTQQLHQSDIPDTDVLISTFSPETTLLSEVSQETTILGTSEQTTVLPQTSSFEANNNKPKAVVEVDISFNDSDEIID